MPFIILFIAAFLLAIPPAEAQQRYPKDQQFSTVMPELPLMQNMKELEPPTEPTNPKKLQNPNETKAVVSGIDRMVKTYYQQELWSQGWKNPDPAKPYVFVKDGQSMTMETEFADGQTTVTFKRKAGDATATEEEEKKSDTNSRKNSNRHKRK